MRMRLGENQEKVIRDKYLRDAPTPEAWLRGVASSVALAELLHDARAQSWGAFDGVSAKWLDVPACGRAPAARVPLLHHGLDTLDARSANFARLLANLERACARHPEARALRDAWAERYFVLMASWDFLPNSPTLMNAGRELQQLSACYVLPVPDSMDGIMRSATAASLIQKSGGGTGFSFSSLRPAGDPVRKSAGVASGALSFMKLFDAVTETVKQGGTRRGANMAVLRYDHPEILDFIRVKSEPGVLENFNVSVGVDAAFMEAVEADAEYPLVNPRTGESPGRLRAREVFDAMCERAWATGDPGYVVLDRVNGSASNPTPGLGRIESTNPCGEQPLLPWEPCNLGSLNLANFAADGKLDFPRLKEAAALAVRFLDDVIDVNDYPLPEVEAMAKGNRRVGLGVMGWAEALVKLGAPYDSPEALALADRVMSFLNGAALEASEALAAERGVFPHWSGSVYDPASPHFRGEERRPRHCARTTIAPTGTIALAAGLQGGGIEPFFALAYTRYNARGLDAVKAGREPGAQDVLREVNPLLRAEAERRDWFGLGEEELWRRVEANGQSLRGLAEVPEDVRRLFVSAHDISPEAHIRMQAAFQKHVDNGVSKTINLPSTASVESVRQAYRLAYELGCKGVTVYRDGSKSRQVLNLKPAAGARRREPDPAFGLSSDYYQVRTGYGPLHVHVNYDERGPFQVFAAIPPLGTEIAALTALTGILISKYLAEGGDPLRLLKHLDSVKGDKPIGLGPGRVDSIAHGVAIALRAHLRKTGWLPDGPAPAPPPPERCPQCHSPAVSMESGCSGPTCHDCGYSACS
jgi:ribonucleoside-diphosphate reductase alpha chain